LDVISHYTLEVLLLFACLTVLRYAIDLQLESDLNSGLWSTIVEAYKDDVVEVLTPGVFIN
jgi:hypothetical protein